MQFSIQKFGLQASLRIKGGGDLARVSNWKSIGSKRGRGMDLLLTWWMIMLTGPMPRVGTRGGIMS